MKKKNKFILVFILLGLLPFGFSREETGGIVVEEESIDMIDAAQDSINAIFCNQDLTKKELVSKIGYEFSTKGKKDFGCSQNYSNFQEFLEYWKYGDALQSFQDTFNIPTEIILATYWLETNGGLKGAGKRGAGFGIKKSRPGKSLKAFDKVDAKVGHGHIYYQGYEERWENFSHFCKLLTNKVENKNLKLYLIRYKEWEDYFCKKGEVKESYYIWALAMQVSPSLYNSYLSYSMQGVMYERKNGKILNSRHNFLTYKKRKSRSFKMINLIKKYIKKD